MEARINCAQAQQNQVSGGSDHMADGAVRDPQASGWEEVTATLTVYLAACGISDDAKALALMQEIKHRMAARLPLRADESLPAVAVEEVEKLMDRWITQALGLKYPFPQQQLFAARMAILSSAVRAAWANGHELSPAGQAEALRSAMVIPLPPKSELAMEAQPLELGYWNLRSLLKYELSRLVHYFRRRE